MKIQSGKHKCFQRLGKDSLREVGVKEYGGGGALGKLEASSRFRCF